MVSFLIQSDLNVTDGYSVQVPKPKLWVFMSNLDLLLALWARYLRYSQPQATLVQSEEDAECPQGGRNWEGFSNDPYLSGIAMAHVSCTPPIIQLW